MKADGEPLRKGGNENENSLIHFLVALSGFEKLD
jgi:hypothetical protein